jgi:hypothetical protein
MRASYMTMPYSYLVAKNILTCGVGHTLLHVQYEVRAQFVISKLTQAAFIACWWMLAELAYR